MNVTPRHRTLLTPITVVAIIAFAGGCGGDSKDDKRGDTKSVPEVVRSEKAKPNVQEHGALVYGAFREYIEEPARDGAFQSGADGRNASIARAKAAILVMVRELGETKQAALTDDRLRPVTVKINDLMPRLSVLLTSLNAGKTTQADVAAAASAVDDIVQAAKAGGATIALDKVPELKSDG